MAWNSVPGRVEMGEDAGYDELSRAF
jgi:hypothetical protein